MGGHLDVGVGTVSGADIVLPLGQLLSWVESLAIAEQVETLRCRDVTVAGVKPGEVFLCQRLLIMLR